MKVELKKRKGVFSDRDVYVIFKDGKLMEGFITFDIQEAIARFLEEARKDKSYPTEYETIATTEIAPEVDLTSRYLSQVSFE